MKLLLKILIPAVLIAFAVYFAVGKIRPEVRVAQATRGLATDAVTGTVEVFANVDIDLKTETPGRVIEVPVKRGEWVEKDQVVCRLDSEDLELQLRQKKIQLDAALEKDRLPIQWALELQNAEEEFEKLEQMAAADAVPPSQVEQKRRDLEKLRAFVENERISRREGIELLRAQIEHIENQLEKMTIIAPWAGEVVEIKAFPGDWLYGGNAVCRLVSPGRWVNLTLAEEDAFGVEEGDAVRIRLAGKGGETVHGEVTGLAATADADKKTRDAFVHVDKSADYLVPGFTGEGIVVKQEREDAVIIPRRGLIGNVVYVVNDGNVQIREVEPGFLGLREAEIRDGIEPGDLIVIEGQSALRQGDSVEVVMAE